VARATQPVRSTALGGLTPPFCIAKQCKKGFIGYPCGARPSRAFDPFRGTSDPLLHHMQGKGGVSPPKYRLSVCKPCM
jgi:hypothetical protein